MKWVAGRTMRSLFAMLLIAAGAWQVADGAYIHIKALTAQYLLQSAWLQARQGERQVRPWPWADTWPVARLRVERLGVDQIVLAGSSGRSLAFGPGHIAGTDPFTGHANSVISGHRDTHFRFLQSLRVDDRLRITRSDGRELVFAVARFEVVHEEDTSLLDQGRALLTLITCYPFDALVPGGPLRFVVVAEPVIDSPVSEDGRRVLI